MAKTFDVTKPCRTDGLPARIICTDRKGVCPVVALVDVGDGSEQVRGYCLDGSSPSGKNLVNVPERRSEFRNVYEKEVAVMSLAYDTLERAKQSGTYYSKHGTLELVFENDVLVDTVFHKV